MSKREQPSTSSCTYIQLTFRSSRSAWLTARCPTQYCSGLIQGSSSSRPPGSRCAAMRATASPQALDGADVGDGAEQAGDDVEPAAEVDRRHVALQNSTSGTAPAGDGEHVVAQVDADPLERGSEELEVATGAASDVEDGLEPPASGLEHELAQRSGRPREVLELVDEVVDRSRSRVGRRCHDRILLVRREGSARVLRRRRRAGTGRGTCRGGERSDRS